MGERRVRIVFYSDTGHTRHVAEDLVEALGGELVMLHAPDLGSGILGAFRRVRDSLLRYPARIECVAAQPVPDDLVIVGSPVWAARLASPVRAWLLENAGQIGRYAVFVTLGSSGAERALGEVSDLMGHPPEATLVVSDRDRKSGDAAAKIEAFAAKLGGRGEASVPAADVLALRRS